MPTDHDEHGGAAIYLIQLYDDGGIASVQRTPRIISAGDVLTGDDRQYALDKLRAALLGGGTHPAGLVPGDGPVSRHAEFLAALALYHSHNGDGAIKLAADRWLRAAIDG